MILVDILITFSRAPTPLTVLEHIACAFCLYKSRTRFGYTNRRLHFEIVKTVNCHCPRATLLRFYENFN